MFRFENAVFEMFSNCCQIWLGGGVYVVVAVPVQASCATCSQETTQSFHDAQLWRRELVLLNCARSVNKQLYNAWLARSVLFRQAPTSDPRCNRSCEVRVAPHPIRTSGTYWPFECFLPLELSRSNFRSLGIPMSYA